MKKFEMDLSEVSKTVVPDTNRIPLTENEHRMVRVAFDLFRLKDSDPDELWQVQSSDDGEFLVRTYALPEDENTVISDWSIKEDGKKANLTISYKGMPITRVIAAEYGANTEEDVFVLQKTLFKKLATDKGFIIRMLNKLPEIKQEMLKEAGLIKDLKNRLTLEDVSDGVMEVVKENDIDPTLSALELKLQKQAGGFESEISPDLEKLMFDDPEDLIDPEKSPKDELEELFSDNKEKDVEIKSNEDDDEWELPKFEQERKVSKSGISKKSKEDVVQYLKNMPDEEFQQVISTLARMGVV
jgi:hypothetical protein